MPSRIPTFRPPRLRQFKPADNRPSARQRGYDSRWDKYRKWFLSQPENAVCKMPGCNQPATVVDHVVPHKGNQELFWLESNHQGLCKRCHDSKTAREDGGFGREVKR